MAHSLHVEALVPCNIILNSCFRIWTLLAPALQWSKESLHIWIVFCLLFHRCSLLLVLYYRFYKNKAKLQPLVSVFNSELTSSCCAPYLIHQCNTAFKNLMLWIPLHKLWDKKIKLMKENNGRQYTLRKTHSVLASDQYRKLKSVVPETSTKVHNWSSQASRYFGQVLCKVSQTPLLTLIAISVLGIISLARGCRVKFSFNQSFAGSALLNTIWYLNLVALMQQNFYQIFQGEREVAVHGFEYLFQHLMATVRDSI